MSCQTGFSPALRTATYPTRRIVDQSGIVERHDLGRGTRVTAEASTFKPFWLSPLPTETSGQLIDDLLQQCGGERHTAVTIGTQTAWVIIGQQEKIVATGYCVESG